jgi:hypothetical protein
LLHPAKGGVWISANSILLESPGCRAAYGETMAPLTDNSKRTGAAIEAHYRFLAWLVPTIEKFPKSHKFTIGDRNSPLRCMSQHLCRFSDAGNDDPTTRSGGRRRKSAKARNRGVRKGVAVPRAMGILPRALAWM